MMVRCRTLQLHLRKPFGETWLLLLLLLLLIIVLQASFPFRGTGRVVRLDVSILRAMGSYPTQWTSTYVLVGGRWLNKPL